jgi:hypothetical protein
MRQETSDRTTKKEAHDHHVDFQRENKSRWHHQIQGIMQIPGVDYTESFAPVASDSGIRIVIGIFLFFLHMFPQDEWVLETFDVEVAFLNVLYLDDTLCAGERKEVEWAYKKIEEKIKIAKLGRLKKHLGTIYEWKQDK